MYLPHPVLTTPNPDTILWRYISLAKFLDMLDRRALWFTQLDSLPDPFEGVPAEIILEGNRATREKLRTMMIEGGMDADTARKWNLPPSYTTTRQITYVNSWHMNDFESMAMWATYSKEGLAIRSTFQ